MRFLSVPIFLFLAFVLQALLAYFVRPDLVAPDFVLATVAAFAVVARPGPALSAAAAGGLIQDAVSAGYVGLNGISKLIVCYLLQRFSDSWPALSPPAFLLVVSLASFADGLLIAALRIAVGAGAPLPGAVPPFLLGIPVTALYAVFLYAALGRMRSVSRRSSARGLEVAPW